MSRAGPCAAIEAKIGARSAHGEYDGEAGARKRIRSGRVRTGQGVPFPLRMTACARLGACPFNRFGGTCGEI